MSEGRKGYILLWGDDAVERVYSVKEEAEAANARLSAARPERGYRIQDIEYCCKRMTEHQMDGIDGRLETSDDEICMNGCCGGGCYVLTGAKFCPFCGTALKAEWFP